MIYLFWLSIIGIFYTFIGYPFSLYLLEKILKEQRVEKWNKEEEFPKITYIIAAYNEEKNIKQKLENTILLNYPQDKLEIIVASDGSTDKTNDIVKRFIKERNRVDIKLYEVKKRKGKTNAQNEAIAISKGEVIVFSDANSIWEKEALKNLILNFKDSRIDYVCGKLEYINSLENITSNAENTYWNYDLWLRKIESNLLSITAGNGAIYAIKADKIEIIPEIECHDGIYPTISVLKGRRAIYEEKAVAYEKAGENISDEFKRKVRMGRGILSAKYSNLQKYNFFKTGIFSYFYFCHRYLRYSLYLFHIFIYISNIFLLENKFYLYIFILQNLFYLLAILGNYLNIKYKILYLPYYYMMTVAAQLIAVIKSILGLNKPFWEKAESTR